MRNYRDIANRRSAAWIGKAANRAAGDDAAQKPLESLSRLRLMPF